MSIKPHRLLIADDEDHTRTALVRAFQLKGYYCRGAFNGKDALTILDEEDYDLLLLDLRMPELDGVAVMKAVKKRHPNLIVIILTAHASLESAITAVKAGAADYLIKPQSINDLEIAIQRALSERAPHIHRDQLISFMQQSLEKLKEEPVIPDYEINPSISINLDNHQIVIKRNNHQKTVDLTPDQTKILYYLNANYGKVITCREITLNVLGYPDLSEKEAENMVRPHILRIRRKIETSPKDPQILRTVRGCGYILRLENE
ncbi:MAG: hypothetical protein CL609_01125 [Anaerolineaceae bacterium]|nr:hypothetical protein [Anaerolineaceae bacterium]